MKSKWWSRSGLLMVVLLLGAPIANAADFVHIPPGTFIMGSPTDEPGRDIDETLHQVILGHGFAIQPTEVTNQQYMELAQWACDHGYATATSSGLSDNINGSTQFLKTLGPGTEMTFSAGVFSCVNPTHPVKYVAWYGAAAYCDWLSLQQGLPRAYNHSTWQCNGGSPYSAAGYRLPTEAEWEYACRAGSTTAFANGPITHTDCSPLDPNLDLMGWYCGNANDWTHPVAQKLPNAWGLYDMHGNVCEWCNDWYGAYGGDVTDPVGSVTGTGRVLRSGTWLTLAWACSSADRHLDGPDASNSSVGFRPVKSTDQTDSEEVLFFDDFRGDLSRWIGQYGGGHYGVTVADPLNAGNWCLAFSATHAGGDMFSLPIAVDDDSTYVLEFDYLGRPDAGQPSGDLGGFIGVSVDLYAGVGGFLAADCLGHGIIQLLEADGQWHHYSIEFCPGTRLQTTTSSIRVMIEDFFGNPSGECSPDNRAGDALFDNVTLLKSSPRIMPRILDVASDQGGFLRVGWARHAYDIAAHAAQVTSYEVQRQQTSWTSLASVAATQADSYSVVVATPDILTIGQPVPYSRFRVVARTANPEIFYESLPDSGYSIDNLPPDPPQMTLYDGETFRSLAWQNPAAPDFGESCLYRGSEPGFEAGDPLLCSATQYWYQEDHLSLYYYRARAFDVHGNASEWSNEVVGQYPTGVPDAATALRLYPNQPNPFNPMTTIRFDLPEPGRVRLAIYDLAGRLLKVLVGGEMAAGSHEAVWDGRDAEGRALASGPYFARLEAGGKVGAVRMSLVR